MFDALAVFHLHFLHILKISLCTVSLFFYHALFREEEGKNPSYNGFPHVSIVQDVIRSSYFIYQSKCNVNLFSLCTTF